MLLYGIAGGSFGIRNPCTDPWTFIPPLYGSVPRLWARSAATGSSRRPTRGLAARYASWATTILPHQSIDHEGTT